MRESFNLSSTLKQDPHNGANGYMVRSLYFDTVYDSDYFDKETGVDVRRKVRLRIYDCNDNYAKLEMKQKQGKQQLKRSLKVSKTDAESIINCDFKPLLFYKDDFAKEMYAFMKYRCYRPKTIVEYNRKAFIARENRVRITFDRNIVSTESNFDLFSEELLLNPVLDYNRSILEIKYDGYLLDYIKYMLKGMGKSELSVSKYCLARQNSYHRNL